MNGKRSTEEALIIPTKYGITDGDLVGTECVDEKLRALGSEILKDALASAGNAESGF